MTRQFQPPRFKDITPETERLAKLDHFWISIDSSLRLWRFSYLWDEDPKGKHIPPAKSRFYEPVLLIHGIGKDHRIFNWLARELWYFGFRLIFSIDFSNNLSFIENAEQLGKVIADIRKITKAYRISMITNSSGGLSARFYSKFIAGADSNIRILAMIESPHHKANYLGTLANIRNLEVSDSQINQQLDYLEDMNAETTEKELYRLTLVNIGTLKYPGIRLRQAGTLARKFVPLSDAINITVGLTHLRVLRHKTIFRLLRPFLIPEVAVFKIRLLTLTAYNKQIFLRIHFKNRVTQKYPQRGLIHFPSSKEAFIPQVPMVVFASYFPLDDPNPPRLSIYAFHRTKSLGMERIGKIEVVIAFEKLPSIEYHTLLGRDGERIDFALYTYIP
ncbi:MAG: esterase/lipase family protein [Candidatus Thorarchaeota archaeon]